MKVSKIKREKIKRDIHDKKIKHLPETIKLSWTKWHFHDNNLEPRVTYFCVVSGQGEYGLLHHLGLHGSLAQLVDVLLLGCGLPTDVPRLLRGPHGYCVSFLKVQDQIEFGNQFYCGPKTNIIYYVTSKWYLFPVCVSIYCMLSTVFFCAFFTKIKSLL